MAAMQRVHIHVAHHSLQRKGAEECRAAHELTRHFFEALQAVHRQVLGLIALEQPLDDVSLRKLHGVVIQQSCSVNLCAKLAHIHLVHLCFDLTTLAHVVGDPLEHGLDRAQVVGSEAKIDLSQPVIGEKRPRPAEHAVVRDKAIGEFQDRAHAGAHASGVPEHFINFQALGVAIHYDGLEQTGVFVFDMHSHPIAARSIRCVVLHAGDR
ncbi:hypothetical protein D3C71_1623160 [compost metagenome]